MSLYPQIYRISFNQNLDMKAMTDSLDLSFDCFSTELFHKVQGKILC